MPLLVKSQTTSEMEQLRELAAFVRHGAPPSRVLRAFERAFSLCETLERDLAGAELASERRSTEIATRADEADQVFEVMPVACLELDHAGVILRANRAAAVLLNTSSKRLAGRLLLHFVEDREQFWSFLQRLADARDELTLSCRVRPRERAPLTVDGRVVRRIAEKPPTSLMFITPAAGALEQRSAPRATPSTTALDAQRDSAQSWPETGDSAPVLDATNRLRERPRRGSECLDLGAASGS